MSVAAVLLGRASVHQTSEEDSIERWEREYPEECAKLRDQIARQIIADVGGRQISEQTLRLMGRAQYRHVQLRRIRQTSAVGAM